ncbi:MAG: membrane dipeptidase [Burkholderiaceae bacterium]|nr:membrane dipeptidase [Burkholderiaceae bacterium]
MTDAAKQATDAARLHADALVWDQTFPATPTCGSWTSHYGALERMKASGYDAVSITVASDPDDALGAIRRISMWRRFINENSDRYTLLASARDAEAAKKAGKLALGFSFQGTTPFERDIGLVEVFYKLGVRHALIAYNQKNHVGDGCHERTDCGLSRFGVELVREMQRVGMLVDCTHTGRRTSLDVFEMASAPVIYSHCNAAALKAHERNIDDQMAKACAATGGVIGVNGIGIFLGDNDDSTDALFAHLDHWVELLGAKHVGIGLDSVSDPATLTATVQRQSDKYPAGQGYETTMLRVSTPEQIPQLTERMLRARYSEADIRAVLGGNWLRLAREVWKEIA